MMPSGSLAIGWMIWRRNRVMATIVCAYYLLVSLLCHVMPREDSYQAICVLLLLPSVFAFIWLLGEFSFGMEFDLASRESGFPARMFTLPIPIWQMVGIPMLGGALIAAGGWIFFSELLLRPRGADTAMLWPAMFMAGLLVWVQALSWSAFPHAWLRVVVALTLLTSYVVLVAFLQNRGTPDWLLALTCAAQIPIAFGIAARGVASARVGRSGFVWQFPTISWPDRFRTRRRFQSSQQAQAWFEWRANGMSLPVMTLFAAIVIVGLARISGPATPNGPLGMLVVGLIFFPLMVSTTTAPTMARFQRNQRVQPIVAFMGTRPLSTGDLVMAKFKASAKSVLVSYGIVLIGITLMFLLTATGPWAQQMAQNSLADRSRAEVVAMVLFAIVALPAFSWLSIVNNLWLGLTGRKWITIAYFAACIALLLAIVITWGILAERRSFQENFPSVLPWLLGALATIKLILAGIACRFAMMKNAVRGRTIAIGAVAWCGFVVGMAAMTMWFARESTTGWYALPGAILLGVPGMGIALAPVALDWNRHGR